MRIIKRKKVIWKANDIFVIPLLNGKYSIGHILDQRMINTVRIALYDEVLSQLDKLDIESLVNSSDLISLIEVFREKLDYGEWPIIGNKQTVIPVEKYANEQFRSNNWINSVTFDAGLAEDFINSYYGLLPWDDWYDPNYLDKFLVDPAKKPNNLIYKKQ